MAHSRVPHHHCAFAMPGPDGRELDLQPICPRKRPSNDRNYVRSWALFWFVFYFFLGWFLSWLSPLVHPQYKSNNAYAISHFLSIHPGVFSKHSPGGIFQAFIPGISLPFTPGYFLTIHPGVFPYHSPRIPQVHSIGRGERRARFQTNPLQRFLFN